jgi:O-antigen/teichoic acid export membrane protein
MRFSNSTSRVLASLQRWPLLWQSGVGLLLQTVGKGIGFLLTLVLARVLQASEFGVFAYGRNIIFLIAPIATLGYVVAATRFLPDYLTQNKFGEANGFTRHTLLIVFISGFALALITSLIFQTDPDIVDNSYLSALNAILPSTPFYAILFVLVSVGRSYGLTALAYAPLLVLQPFTHLTIFSLAVTLGATADGVTASLAFTIATILVCLGSVPWLRYSIPGPVLAARCVWAHRDWLGFSLPTAIGLAASSFMVRFPILALGLFSPNSEVGRFVVILALAQVLAIPRDAIAGALAPEIMRRLSEKDANGLRDVLRRGLVSSFGITFFGALGLWVFGDFVLAALGPSFVGSQLLLLLIIADQLIQACSLLLSTFLSVAERPRVNVIILSASALVCVFLATGLAAYFGAIGAAIGALGGSLTLLLATLFMCWKRFKLVYV